jgi:hypothetical protein
MAATDHKTLNVFKRYNVVSQDRLKALEGNGGGDIQPLFT